MFNCDVNKIVKTCAKWTAITH